jgi:hypothetical protein
VATVKAARAANVEKEKEGMSNSRGTTEEERKVLGLNSELLHVFLCILAAWSLEDMNIE